MAEQQLGKRILPTVSRPPAGIDRLLADRAWIARLARLRVGLLCNRSSLTSDGTGSAVALARALGGGARGLVRLFAPEHGWSGVEPEGGPDSVETTTGLPVHSLYGPRRAPDAAALADLDVVLVDLQDVGVRCYTYASTAALLLRALARQPDKEALLCDRANPLGPGHAGPRLDPALRSFIGYFDLPFVHGRTLGGLLGDWARQALPGLCVTRVDAPAALAPPAPWVPPSPSLRDWDAVRLYPGLVLLEGTSVSEGRGTPYPFRAVLAPGLDGAGLADAIRGWSVPVAAAPILLRPESGKFAGEECTGVALTLTGEVPALDFGVRLLDWLRRNHGAFAWRLGRVMATADGERFTPTDGPLLDYLIGDAGLRRDLDAGAGPDALVARWAK